jgi:hypothetical protein
MIYATEKNREYLTVQNLVACTCKHASVPWAQLLSYVRTYGSEQLDSRAFTLDGNARARAHRSSFIHDHEAKA